MAGNTVITATMTDLSHVVDQDRVTTVTPRPGNAVAAVSVDKTVSVEKAEGAVRRKAYEVRLRS